MAKLSRRQALAVAGAATLGVAVGGGAAVTTLTGRRVGPVASTRGARATVDGWLATRTVPFFVAHRGAGDVAPEHTLPGYLQGLNWGAECLEISVVMSADRVLYCQHDLTLDRTTTLTGAVADKRSAQLDQARVSVPRLGPRWSGDGMPRLPRFADVLAAVGGRAVLCIEAKDDSAYGPMVAIVEAMGLKDSTIIKVDASSPRLNMAQKAGYPVFAYLGNPQVATGSAIRSLGRRLDPRRDLLILPARAGWDFFPHALIMEAVATRVPVGVFPVHRRYGAEHFAALGVQTIVTPDLGYLNGSVPRQSSDSWVTGAITAGELTKDPYSNSYGLSWPGDASITLAVPGQQAFLTLGQFSPLTTASYRVAFDAMYSTLPSSGSHHFSLAFGHADDRYYEHQLGTSNGYHALLRANGELAIYAHLTGRREGQLLVRHPTTGPLRAGEWTRMTLDVTPDILRWSRDDGTTIEVPDRRFRGGYVHIGRNGTDGSLTLRNLSAA